MFIPLFTFAVVGPITIPTGIPNEVPKIGNYISAIVGMMVLVAGLFSFWQFLSGGLKYITSGGDKGKVTEATNQMTYAITGLVITVASVAVTAIVSQILFGSWSAILSPKFTPIN